MTHKFGWMLLTIFPAFAAGSEWETHVSRGEALERNGRYEQAVSEFEAALRFAADAETAVTYNDLGAVYRALGRPHEAERSYHRAIAFYETRPEFSAALATSVENLAALQLTTGHVSQAESLYRRSYAIRLAVLPAGDAAIAGSLQGLARVEQERHHATEAERYYRQALAIHESAAVLHNFATLLTETGRFQEARIQYERALAMYRIQSPGHPAEAIVLRYLAELDAHDGNAEKAEAEFRQAVAICESALPPDHPQTGVIVQAYGVFLTHAKRKKEAASVVARANRILGKAAMESGAAYVAEAESFGGRK